MRDDSDKRDNLASEKKKNKYNHNHNTNDNKIN